MQVNKLHFILKKQIKIINFQIKNLLPDFTNFIKYLNISIILHFNSNPHQRIHQYQVTIF